MYINTDIAYTSTVGKYKIHLHSQWSRAKKLIKCTFFCPFL